MLKDATDQGEKSAAANALYVLSFDKENKDIIKDDSDIMGLLRNLQHSGDKAIRQAMSGVIWEIAGKEEHKPKSSGMFALSLFYFNNTMNQLWL